MDEKIKQPGVQFPSAKKQEHVLIIRLDISPTAIKPTLVRDGLKRLCRLFERIENCSKRADELLDDGSLQRSPLSNFNFSATIGFGITFFERLNIPKKNQPKKLKEMPSHPELGDPTPYSLAQTDLIIQLGSTKDFINRWVLENTLQPPDGHETRRQTSTIASNYFGLRKEYINKQEEDRMTPDIITAVQDWATMTDVHAGFQRIDGRNLMGFNDGVSNPRRLSPLFDKVVWTTEMDEGQGLAGGTYMVFQKIEHDLEQWRQLDLEKQEQWVGRSKGTGLLLGSLPKDEDRNLSYDLGSNDPGVRNSALKRWKELFREQLDPEKRLFDGLDPKYKDIQLECPVWSHVRKANPRQVDGTPTRLIFRRGYLYMEPDLNSKIRSGLLFICFQSDIENGFEFIKKKWLNNKAFPVPEKRTFTEREKAFRHEHGRFTYDERKGMNHVTRKDTGLSDLDTFSKYQRNADKPDTQNTGREGLAGPSELGVNPTGAFLSIVPFGGGYYFIPPIPIRSFSDIGHQFFW